MLAPFALLAALAIPAAHAQEDSCATEEATFDYREGFRAQRGSDTENAIASYSRCLEKDPNCLACQYEIGWSYWTRSEWDSVIAWTINRQNYREGSNSGWL